MSEKRVPDPQNSVNDFRLLYRIFRHFTGQELLDILHDLSAHCHSSGKRGAGGMGREDDVLKFS